MAGLLLLFREAGKIEIFPVALTEQEQLESPERLRQLVAELFENPAGLRRVAGLDERLP